jgi:opacity protein-like surface antigen
MMGRTLLRVCFATLGLGIAGAANAADYDGQLPGEGFNGMFSCMYARVDGGVAMYQRPTVIQPIGGLFDDGAGNFSSEALNEKITPGGFFEGGLGCQVSDNMRIEVTGGMHLKSTLDAVAGSLNAEIASQHVFVSTFWDITNYAGFTPYVGGGIGAARNEITGLTAPSGAAAGGDYDFAYHVTLGFSYDLTQSLKFDLAYRYIDMGDVISGVDYTAVEPGAISVDGIKAHEVKAGIRYHFGGPAW